ncbi:2TM domain-containing protein [Polaribacter sp.]|uniref:2TM domain-containing protein n=1 Tax=Polaribacter sp. TaxID=1920175 RepID=UPI003F69FD44
MNIESNNHQLRLKAAKRVKEIKGFYTHVLATFIIPPFLVFINLQTVPQFHWFWFAIIVWFVGLIIHWFGVFGFDKLGFGKNWEEKKIKEFINKK